MNKWQFFRNFFPISLFCDTPCSIHYYVLYTIPDWLSSFPLSPGSSPAPVFSSHGGDRSEGVNNYFLRGFPQVVAVHRLEHPSGSLDLLGRGGEGLAWVLGYLLTLDLVQGTMKVGFRSSPGRPPLLPITRYLLFLWCWKSNVTITHWITHQVRKTKKKP